MQDTAKVHPGDRNRTGYTYSVDQTRVKGPGQSLIVAPEPMGKGWSYGPQVGLVRKIRTHSPIYVTDTVTTNSLEHTNAKNRPQPICFSSFLLSSSLRTSKSTL